MGGPDAQCMNGSRIESTAERMSRDSTVSPLPPDLLQAISSPSVGGIVLVLGAGCSNEEPTALPLASKLSDLCCRKLFSDGVLRQSDVRDRYDLSAVAEAVFEQTGSQRALVERFPGGEFRQAEPNDGYLIMAALLIEGSITDVLTLNFDLAARNALAQLGAGARVSTVRGPEEHRQLAARNLIYLHRDIDSSPDDIILRQSKLEEAWQNSWEEVVTGRVLASPTTVFVGLGSPASVLVATMKRIVGAIGKTQTNVYVVDPSLHEESDFARALGIGSNDYITMGWGDFMRALAQRVAEEHCAGVENACGVLVSRLGIYAENVSDICSRLAEMGLLGLGQLRAAWMLDSRSYLPYDQSSSLQLFCDLVLGVGLLERESGRQARFGKDGIVELLLGKTAIQVLVCSGSGLMNEALVAAELSRRREDLQREGRAPSIALVAGVVSGAAIVTPSDIAVETRPDDIVAGAMHFPIVSITELRAAPSRVREVIR